jgi:hypothetical protein
MRASSAKAGEGGEGAGDEFRSHSCWYASEKTVDAKRGVRRRSMRVSGLGSDRGKVL